MRFGVAAMTLSSTTERAPCRMEATHTISITNRSIGYPPEPTAPRLPHRWKKPPTGFVALNCDGSVTNHGNSAGCGGLCRNEEGRLLFAYTHKLDPCSIVEAEIWGLYHGLCIARSLTVSRRLICCKVCPLCPHRCTSWLEKLNF